MQGYAREVATRLAGEIEKLGPVRAFDPWRCAAGVRLQAGGRDRELHGVRSVQCAARPRLAAARLHVPEEPHGSRGVACRRPPRRHARPLRPADLGHQARTCACSKSSRRLSTPARTRRASITRVAAALSPFIPSVRTDSASGPTEQETRGIALMALGPRGEPCARRR